MLISGLIGACSIIVYLVLSDVYFQSSPKSKRWALCLTGMPFCQVGIIFGMTAQLGVSLLNAWLTLLLLAIGVAIWQYFKAVVREVHKVSLPIMKCK